MMELDGDITQCYRTPEPTLNQIIIALTAPYSEMLFSECLYCSRFFSSYPMRTDQNFCQLTLLNAFFLMMKAMFKTSSCLWTAFLLSWWRTNSASVHPTQSSSEAKMSLATMLQHLCILFPPLAQK